MKQAEYNRTGRMIKIINLSNVWFFMFVGVMLVKKLKFALKAGWSIFLQQKEYSETVHIPVAIHDN